MMKSRYIIWLMAAVLTLGSTQSCGVFKKDCDCPSPHGGKRR